MNCPNCGATVPPRTSRCLKCGSFVEQQATQQATQPTPGPVAAPTQEAVPVGPPAKSKLAAGLLGIFLGWLGIHRFYLGYVSIGVIQLLMSVMFSWCTFGITAVAAGIWGLIEGIMILVGSFDKDAKGRSLKE